MEDYILSFCHECRVPGDTHFSSPTVVGYGTFSCRLGVSSCKTIDFIKGERCSVFLTEWLILDSLIFTTKRLNLLGCKSKRVPLCTINLSDQNFSQTHIWCPVVVCVCRRHHQGRLQGPCVPPEKVVTCYLLYEELGSTIKDYTFCIHP